MTTVAASGAPSSAATRPEGNLAKQITVASGTALGGAGAIAAIGMASRTMPANDVPGDLVVAGFLGGMVLGGAATYTAVQALSGELDGWQQAAALTGLGSLAVGAGAAALTRSTKPLLIGAAPMAAASLAVAAKPGLSAIQDAFSAD